MTEVSYTHACGVVVKWEGKYPKYLLVRSSSNPSYWDFPKGDLKPGESPDEHYPNHRTAANQLKISCRSSGSSPKTRSLLIATGKVY